MSQPVQFRTSPPVDAHKPGRSLSPPPKLFHASVRDPRPPRPRSRPRPHPLVQDYVDADTDPLTACSPRKRHRPPHRLPRPCLDFEKMQQVSQTFFSHRIRKKKIKLRRRLFIFVQRINKNLYDSRFIKIQITDL